MSSRTIARPGLMKMNVINAALYAIDASRFDRPDQSVAGDHRSGLDVEPGYRATHLAQVIRQRCRDRRPAVLVEPILGRVVLLVVDQLEKQSLVTLGRG